MTHIFGSPAHAACALELLAGGDPTVGADHVAQSRALAPPAVVDVVRRYPVAPVAVDGSERWSVSWTRRSADSRRAAAVG